MSENVSPGVVLLCDFVQAAAAQSNFGGFLDYMDRPEAFKEVRVFDGDLWTQNQQNRADPIFGGYMDYMKNDEKSDGIFTSVADNILPAQVELLKNYFDRSQKKGCPLYRGVISFDNAFLWEQGIIFESELDRNRLKEITRESVTKLLQNSQLDPGNAKWTAAIHSNTDNVHVHFAMIEEKKINRKYDMLPQRAIDQAKKTVVNKLIGSEASILRSALLRDELLPGIKRTAEQQGELLVSLLQQLPEAIRWEYNRKNFEPYQKCVNETIDKLIDADPDVKKSFDAYLNSLDDYVLKLRRYYGDGDRRLWENVKSDRLREFYSRSGNFLLKEIQDVKPISIHDFGSMDKYSMDQACAIREGLNKNLDVSCLLDPKLSGKACWEAVRLLEVGTSAADVGKILSAELDPCIIELIAWVREAGKNPAILIEKSWTSEQAWIVSIALRNDLDMKTLSDPSMPAKEMDNELVRLSANVPDKNKYPNWSPDVFYLDIDKGHSTLPLLDDEKIVPTMPAEKIFGAASERTDAAKNIQHPAPVPVRTETGADVSSSLREEYAQLKIITLQRPKVTAPTESKKHWQQQHLDQSAIVIVKSIALAKKLNQQHAKHIKELEKEFDREQNQEQGRSYN